MNIKKIITLVLIVLLINCIFLPKSYGIANVIQNGDKFVASADPNDPIDKDALKKANSNIYNILLGIGIAVAVIIGAFLGIQFIFGSVEGKAKIAEALVPYIIGCAVVFGAFGIWKFAVNAGRDMTPTPTYSETEHVSDLEVADYTIAVNTAKYIEPSFTYHGSNPKVTYSVVSGASYVQLSQDSNSSAVTIRGKAAGTAKIKVTCSDSTTGKELETDTFIVKVTN